MPHFYVEEIVLVDNRGDYVIAGFLEEVFVGLFVRAGDRTPAEPSSTERKLLCYFRWPNLQMTPIPCIIPPHGYSVVVTRSGFRSHPLLGQQKLLIFLHFRLYPFVFLLLRVEELAGTVLD